MIKPIMKYLKLEVDLNGLTFQDQIPVEVLYRVWNKLCDPKPLDMTHRSTKYCDSDTSIYVQNIPKICPFRQSTCHFLSGPPSGHSV